GDDGAAHEGGGAALSDYHAYRLPVLAAAAGTGVKVVGHVPDNPPGQRNPADPWGNLVLLQNGPQLFSLGANLAPGTHVEAPGQTVHAGTRLGLCGNSGRSFVPHVHFHLQTTPRVGAATTALELADVVVGDPAGGEVLRRACLPRQGEVVRALEPRGEIAA